MALSPGTRLGAYEILSLLGSGGMGEVYRAKDTKLDREVAIKVLPEPFVADPERVARFQREAKTLAALNHPHIGGIYGLEDADGVRALVLELVEGETLAEKITGSMHRDKGGLPVAQALAIAAQLADALDAAHERGIIHRDLKPANIKITPDGTVKVLDFGLARLEPDRTGEGGSAAITIDGTREGVVVGTAAYMSPEQARGQAVDKRTDIWAFGCVLYEMLAGSAALGGATHADVLAAKLEREPNWNALSRDTPRVLIRLVRRCLEKDVKRRLRDIGDARTELETAAEPEASVAAAVVAARTRWLWLGGAITLAAAAALTAWTIGKRSMPQHAADALHLSIPFVEALRLGPFGVQRLTISDDGSRVAYAAASRLWIRRLDQKDATAVGTTGSCPFFSPRGDWVGLFRDSGLFKLPVGGGPETLLASITERPAGATWRADGTIVFATSEGLYQISELGGEPRLLIKPDRSRKERLYAWPQFLPDGRSLAFTMLSDESRGTGQILSLDLRTLQSKVLVTGGTSARYVPTRHLVFASGQTLKIVGFDPRKGQVIGEPESVPGIAVATAPDNGASDFAVSSTGTLVYAPAETAALVAGDLQPNLRTLEWIDRRGNKERVAIEPGHYAYPRVSPDGTRVALDTVRGGRRNIWILTLKRSSMTQLTNGPTEDMLPVWTADGRRIFFASNRSGNFDVYSQAADGASDARLEFAAPGFQSPQALTRDETQLIVYDLFKDQSLLTFGPPPRLEPLLHSDADERLGSLSPDGRWIVYESDESGKQFEIFVRPFPNVSGGREKISVDGGRYPRWAMKGNEITYVSRDGDMMAASVSLAPALKLGPVVKLFSWQKPPPGRSGMPYDISPLDGRFLVTQPLESNSNRSTQISVVMNWMSARETR